MERTKRNKTGPIFWGIVAVAAVACLAAILLRGGKGAKGTVNIYVADELYASYPVAAPRTVTIEGEDGKVNVITIDGTGVVMASSTCSNQVCVNTGRISAEDSELFDLNNWIVCLPNRVSVELAEE
ncbi:MAG: NusG domain II-containing protein [Clostridia bacterium]|nr:NusG domain II-containing protein [Clostridia bacterium]